MEAGGYTSRETAVLIGFTPARVRALARAGVLHPARGERREYRFSFQDLACLRAARALLDAQVSRRRVLRALRLVVRQLPAGRLPSEVQLECEGARVVARDGDVVWSPENGQCWLDFSPTCPDLPVTTLAPREEPARSAESWFQEGLDLEPHDPAGAATAYRQTLERAPDHAGAHVNLGRLHQAAGDPMEAARHYRAALDANPRHATAAFNLGTVLQQLSLVDEAMEAYRAALAIDPLLADAHYNLSLLYQEKGFKIAALAHLKRYRALIDR